MVENLEDRERKRTNCSRNRITKLRDEQNRARDNGDARVRDSGLRGDLERDGSEATTEALDDPCTK